ncbi:hybrid sensor histidine kinase/response regulator [Candidatus Poribacteria bacterium]|nr:hybrid sensor histidine kinase/response regulator [Candidatus Poribacteria bacterium]
MDYSILCVDDEPQILSALHRSLHRYPCTVLVARSGQQALDILSTHKVEVILVDICMPQMSGNQLIAQVHRLYPDTIPIVLSGQADEKMLNQILGETSFHQYIPKPWDDEQLIELVSDAFEKYESQVINRALEIDTETLELPFDELTPEKSQELQSALETLQRMQSALVQNEKMSAIGQLSAGVAHEINNPIAFVSSNLDILQDYVTDIHGYSEAIDQLLVTQDLSLEKNNSLRADFKIDSIMQDILILVQESKEGINRVTRIIESLRDFSHVDRAEIQPADINEGLEKTLKLVWNEIKYRAEVEREYGDLPLVSCRIGQINQVFMNLLVNAAQIIETDGLIRIKTTADEDNVYIYISDNGGGIPDEIQERIFQAFFTTKPVGSGTGLGLTISKSIIERHHGELTVESKEGIGTIFRVTLPIQSAE